MDDFSDVLSSLSFCYFTTFGMPTGATFLLNFPAVNFFLIFLMIVFALANLALDEPIMITSGLVSDFLSSGL